MEFVIFIAFSIQFSALENPSMHPVESSTVLSTKSTGTATHPPRSRKRPRADSEAGVNSDEEDGAVEEGIDEDDGGITDPTKIKRPIISLISPALAAAWRVNQKHPMCFLFNPVSPARRFKRGMVYNEEADFPKDTHDGDITETDGPAQGWMPVDPEIFRCV